MKREAEVISGVPTPEDYLALRALGGLSPFSMRAAQEGLGGTLFGVLLVDRGETVGMGRLIGDGGCFFQIVDIVVHPTYQGHGYGKRIVGELMSWLNENAPAGAYVSLIADRPADQLYAQFGFRETAPVSVGMATRVVGSGA